MQQNSKALQVPSTRNNTSLYQSGSHPKGRGSTMDLRGSQRQLLAGTAGQSSMGLEKRILKGGLNIMRNTKTHGSTCKSSLFYRLLTLVAL